MQLNAWLATRPEARAAWEEDAALNRSLQNLPDAPLSSNFTALVMQAVQREALPTPRVPSAIRLWWRRLSWGIACATVAISAVSVGLQQHHHNNELRARREVATGLAVRSVFQIPDSDPLLRYAAFERPAIYQAFIVSYALFGFTTPYCFAFDVSLSSLHPFL